MEVSFLCYDLGQLTQKTELLFLVDASSFQAVEEKLKYQFKNTELLVRALTHASFAHEEGNHGREDNERLEFLGDAVLGLIVAEKLMERFPDAAEGRLSRWRSHLVSRRALSDVGKRLDLGPGLRLGRGELRTGGQEKPSILSSAFEAVLGAMYLDGGLGPCRELIEQCFQPLWDTWTHEGEPVSLDDKTTLQEKTQSRYKATPLYRVVDAWGPEHAKTFRVEISVQGKVVAEAEGSNKKEAEQRAAQKALEQFPWDTK